uniref:Uncharacterized protein LOC114331484 n=1 Tax=Diabrotica virgifera virgifera TaxID=50390 RepID=A0A6P7FQ29_DIAVI
MNIGIPGLVRHRFSQLTVRMNKTRTQKILENCFNDDESVTDKELQLENLQNQDIILECFPHEPITVNLNDIQNVKEIDISDCSIQFNESRCSHIFSNISLGETEEIIVVETTEHFPTDTVESMEVTMPTSSSEEKIQTNVVIGTRESVDDHMPSTISEANETLAQSTIADPDCIAVDVENDMNTIKRPKRGRKRKVVDQSREIKKKRVNTNKNYVNESGKNVAARVFSGSLFNCACPRKCTKKLSVEKRRAEFDKFWSSGCYEARCALLQGCVKEIAKKRSTSVTSKRTSTRIYNLCDVSICKKTFLNTFQISQARVDSALKKKREQLSLKDKRGQKTAGKNKISQEKKREMKEFIDKFPRYRSHYCRNDTTANFLASHLNLQTVYNLYKAKHPDGVSMSRFRKCFMEDFNLKFKKPHKDTCVLCDSYKAKVASASGNVLTEIENDHKNHLQHAYGLRDQMKIDLQLSKDDATLETLTFDLEKTHNLPELPTNIIYYKRQLNLYNLGIHSGSTGKGYFFVWLEHEGGRGTQEVGSCLKKFIADHLKPTATHLILWSDSCGGQNRSIKMTLMLQHILQTHPRLVKITLKFLQPGHTYLPNDSEFGDVECALKTHNRLYTDLDYMNVMKNCRRKNKFIVTRLETKDFLSIENIINQITNRKSDINKLKVSWLNTFAITLQKEKPTELTMKTKFYEEPQIVDITKRVKGRKVKPDFDTELPLLWPNGKELSLAKVKDLKEMMKLIPSDSKPFYNFLKNTESRDFIDDAEGFGENIDFELEEQ